jgi:hypothetical protein
MARASNAIPLETVARIKQLAAQGLSRPVIAERLQLRKHNVADHLPSSRTYGAPWTDDRVQRLKAMWLDGRSASEIAKDLRGVTRSSVIGKVHRLGLIRSAELHHQSVVRNCKGAGGSKPRRPRAEPQKTPVAKVVTAAAVAGPEAEASVVMGAVNPAPPPLRTIAATWAPKDPVPMGEQRRGHCAWPIETGPEMKACNEPVAGRWCVTHSRIGTAKASPPKTREPAALNYAGRAPARFLARRGGYE